VEPGVRGPVGRPAVDQAAEEEQGLSSRDVDLDRGLTLPCCMPVGMAEDVGARQDVEAHVVLQGHDNGHVEALAERRPAVQLHRGDVPVEDLGMSPRQGVEQGEPLRHEGQALGACPARARRHALHL